MSGAFAIGTEAFTNVSTNRNINIQTTDDYVAVFTLTQQGTGRRSLLDGNPSELQFDIPSPDEGNYPAGNPTDPEGLGIDSVYRFGEDAAHDEPGLFGVKNQGTQPVEVYSTQETTAGVPSVTMYDVETGNLLTESSPSGPLAVGEQLICGLEIDTHGVPVQEEEYDVTLTINAVATD
ncbi:hypothetical protein [Haloarchaeobius amylolyticus]|uniref:hypothetical protein n=1 Tax=Haloarchaeobius amylolyticus TaxID=1198296 RepID=UPI0022715034|nr:hypothetical protein [Haloarchaeobius amylolyticus]